MSTWYDDLFSSTIEPALPPTASLLIYGAGHTGQRVAHALKAEGVVIPAFLDRNAKSGQTVSGIPVLKPPEAVSLKNLSVLVAVFNPHRNARFADVAETLRRRAFRLSIVWNIFIFLIPPAFLISIG